MCPYLLTCLYSGFHSLDSNSICWTGNSAKPSDCSFSEMCQQEEAEIPGQNLSVKAVKENPLCSTVNLLFPDIM